MTRPLRSTRDRLLSEHSSSRGVSRSRWAAVGAAIAVSFGAGGLAITHATSSTGERDVFVPVTPCRLFDTRPATLVGARNTPIGPGGTMVQTVTGSNGNCNLPADARAVAMNVTSVNGTVGSFLTIWPSDAAMPLASSLDWTAGSPATPNKVDVKLAADGKISLFNLAGSVDVLADVVGYYVDHNHDDLYYTKAQIDAKLPTTGSLIIGPAAFQPSYTAMTIGSTFGCHYIVNELLGTDTLDASVQLPVGVTITKIIAMLGNDSAGSQGFVGGRVKLFRRTLGSVTELASVNSLDLPPGTYNEQATLLAPELVTSGRYYSLRYSSAGLNYPNETVCGAEIFYTNPA
jgi:hypothetical protein